MGCCFVFHLFCFTWRDKIVIVDRSNELEEAPALNLEEKSPFSLLDPVKCLRIGGAIILISLIWGLFLPGIVAWRTGIFYDRDAELKVASAKSLQDQARKLKDFEANRALLENAITALDKKLSNFVAASPAPDDVKAAIELQQQLKARMALMKPPIEVSGFYFSSTMLLWPVIFTCLGLVAFLVPPRVDFISFRTYPRRILLFTLGITIFYRWPTWARNFVIKTEGRIFFGIANLDVDPAGFYVQECLGLTVSFLLAVIWTKWLALFLERTRDVSKVTSDPISEALDWSTLAELSRTFMHWQVSSIVLACGFIPYLYFFWDAVLRGHDQRFNCRGHSAGLVGIDMDYNDPATSCYPLCMAVNPSGGYVCCG
jgi:hypothetical protein